MTRDVSTTKDAQMKVQEFIFKKFPLARKALIRDSDSLLGGGILDSQGALEIVAFLEREFGFTVEDEDLTPENFQSIERIAGFAQGKMSNG
jgi:acyl carrier protein